MLTPRAGRAKLPAVTPAARQTNILILVGAGVLLLIGVLVWRLVTQAAAIPPSPASNLHFTGQGASSSGPFDLPAGQYRLLWVAIAPNNGTCHADGVLRAQPGLPPFGEQIVGQDVQGTGNGVTNLFSVRAGPYKVDFTGSCSWDVTVLPGP